LTGRGAERTLPAKRNAVAAKEMAERIIVLLKVIDVIKFVDEGKYKVIEEMLETAAIGNTWWPGNWENSSKQRGSSVFISWDLNSTEKCRCRN
jgi:hypothetical protein